MVIHKIKITTTGLPEVSNTNMLTRPKIIVNVAYYVKNLN